MWCGITRTAARVALLLSAIGVLGPPAWGEEPAAETPGARKKRLEEAKKAKEAADREFAKQVNAAIDKGHAFLKETQRADGTWPFHLDDRQNFGRIALSLLTLVKCGSDEDDVEIVKGMEALLPVWRARRDANEWMTYSIAVTVLFLDALHNQPAPTKDGNYAAPARKKCKYPKDVEEMIREMVRWIVEKQETHVWRYPGGLGGGEKEDLSNTQLALLALQAAGRCGIDAPPGLYKRALEYLLRTQEQDGPEEPLWVPNPTYEEGGEDRYGPFLPGGRAKARGWRYLEKPSLVVSGSMTTAGVACLAIVKERLQAVGELDKETSKKLDRAMLDGMAWIGRNFDVTKNPNQPGLWHYYYLYGLERVGAYTGQTHLGRHDWYREGAEYLIKVQRADGGWPGGSEHEDEFVNTCFALLFLKRATVRPATPLVVITEGN